MLVELLCAAHPRVVRGPGLIVGHGLVCDGGADPAGCRVDRLPERVIAEERANARASLISRHRDVTVQVGVRPDLVARGRHLNTRPSGQRQCSLLEHVRRIQDQIRTVAAAGESVTDRRRGTADRCFGAGDDPVSHVTHVRHACSRSQRCGPMTVHRVVGEGLIGQGHGVPVRVVGESGGGQVHAGDRVRIRLRVGYSCRDETVRGVVAVRRCCRRAAVETVSERAAVPVEPGARNCPSPATSGWSVPVAELVSRNDGGDQAPGRVIAVCRGGGCGPVGENVLEDSPGLGPDDLVRDRVLAGERPREASIPAGSVSSDRSQACSVARISRARRIGHRNQLTLRIRDGRDRPPVDGLGDDLAVEIVGGRLHGRYTAGGRAGRCQGLAEEVVIGGGDGAPHICVGDGLTEEVGLRGHATGWVFSPGGEGIACGRVVACPRERCGPGWGATVGGVTGAGCAASEVQGGARPPWIAAAF